MPHPSFFKGWDSTVVSRIFRRVGHFNGEVKRGLALTFDGNNWGCATSHGFRDNNEGIRTRHVYLPALKDAASIQLAISEICEMVLHRRIETKEAGTLFYAMQVASSNLGQLNGKKGNGKDKSRNEKPDSSAESSSPTPAPPEAVSTAQDDSKSASSASPHRLPPRTIHASAHPRRRVV